MVTRSALVVDDHALTRGLLSHALEHHGFAVTAVASAAEAVENFEACDPDVLIADVHLGTPPSGSELALILATKAPHLAVVLMSNYPAAHLRREASKIPAHTVVAHKDQLSDTDAVIEVVEAALRNRTPNLAPSLRESESSPSDDLTTPQMEVWRLIASGFSNAEIATIRETTVAATERIVTRLFSRLGVDSNARLNARVAAAKAYISRYGPPDQEE